MQADGSGMLIRREQMALAKGQGPEGLLFSPWEEWDRRLFLELCILSGCDYLPHLRGLAIKTAHKLLSAHRNVEHVVKISAMTRPVKMSFAKNMKNIVCAVGIIFPRFFAFGIYALVETESGNHDDIRCVPVEAFVESPPV